MFISFINNDSILTLIRVPIFQAYKCENKVEIYTDSLSWCLVALTSKNSEANKFIVFAYGGSKYYFAISCTMTLFLVKEVFFMF